MPGKSSVLEEKRNGKTKTERKYCILAMRQKLVICVFVLNVHSEGRTHILCVEYCIEYTAVVMLLLYNILHVQNKY